MSLAPAPRLRPFALRFCWLRSSSFLLSLLLVFFLLLSGCSSEEAASPGAGQQRPPTPVTLARVQAEDVEIRVDYAGRVRGSRDVDVRARVGGLLEERLYVEGQQVNEGDALFLIDPEPYEIALRLAEANERNAAAGLEQAERELRRIADLYARNSISQRERDQAETLVKLAESSLAQASARVADARRHLGYTRVTAPIRGATGLETLSEGSLVEVGTLLTRITQKDPAHVRFSLPESDATVQRLARQARQEGGQGELYRASLRLPDGHPYSHPGQVDFTDSSIDPRTGTVSARAIFPNPEGELVPGQFVRLSLVLQQLEQVVTIPPSSVSDGPQGPRVFVVEEQRAQPRLVELGPIVGDRQVIFSGLQPGEQLVVNGQVALHPGAEVQVVPTSNEED